MNERIFELAKQAGYYQTQDVDGSRFDVMPRQCFEKFARLIICETLEVARAGIEFGNGMEDAVEQYFEIKL